jgi:hypothetical protein
MPYPNDIHYSVLDKHEACYLIFVTFHPLFISLLPSHQQGEASTIICNFSLSDYQNYFLYS